MRFYNENIYPWLVTTLGDPEPIKEVRQRIIPLAQGTVLEIGVGPGVNFVHYDPSRVSRVYALEPNPGMIRLAEQHRRQTDLKIEFLDQCCPIKSRIDSTGCRARHLQSRR